MSMSIFSAFDALCAEYLGQKVGLSSWAPPQTPNNHDAPAAAGEIDGLKKVKGVNSSPQPKAKPEDRRRTRTPRFAPELDGVHCFETILPY